MAGDHAVIENFPDLDFEVGNTIAKGGEYCQIKYFKKE